MLTFLCLQSWLRANVHISSKSNALCDTEANVVYELVVQILGLFLGLWTLRKPVSPTLEGHSLIKYVSQNLDGQFEWSECVLPIYEKSKPHKSYVEVTWFVACTFLTAFDCETPHIGSCIQALGCLGRLWNPWEVEPFLGGSRPLEPALRLYTLTLSSCSLPVFSGYRRYVTCQTPVSAIMSLLSWRTTPCNYELK